MELVAASRRCAVCMGRVHVAHACNVCGCGQSCEMGRVHAAHACNVCGCGQCCERCRGPRPTSASQARPSRAPSSSGEVPPYAASGVDEIDACKSCTIGGLTDSKHYIPPAPKDAWYPYCLLVA